MTNGLGVGARAAAARTRHVARDGTMRHAKGSHQGWRHNTPDTWVITSMRAAVETWGRHRHDVSKPSVTAARWNAERIGPIVMAAPHRGHVHVSPLTASVVGVASVDLAVVTGVASTVRASATRAARQVLARNPDCRIRTKPRGRMCWTKRRRNSIAESVIVRRRSSWA